MPVVPLVGSTIVSPGLRRLLFSAASIMLRAMRSLTLPAGFIDSTLATTSAQPGCTTRFRRSMGVPPTRSRTVSAIFLSLPISLLDYVPCPARLPGAVALRQVADRRAVQHLEDGLAHVLPHVALRAAAVPRAGAALVQAVDGHDGPLQRLDHFRHADVAGLPDQRVATLRPAHAADKAGPAQRGEQLLQVGLRDLLARGYLAALHWAGLTEVVRQLNQSPDAVIAFGGN